MWRGTHPREKITLAARIRGSIPIRAQRKCSPPSGVIPEAVRGYLPMNRLDFAATLTICTLLVSCACQSKLSSARRKVEAVRPTANFAAVRTTRWSELPPTHAIEDGRQLNFNFMGRVFAEQRDSLIRIGVLTDDDARRITDVLFGDASSYAAAFVVPSRDLIVVRPGVERDEHLLAHELGHIASYQAGYDRFSLRRLSLRADDTNDPRWIDIDAALAAWSLDEGMAELTAIATEEHASAGSVDVERLASRVGARFARIFHDPPTAEGPGQITLGDRTVTLAKGEVATFLPTVTDVLIDFAYTGGVRHLLTPTVVPELETQFSMKWSTFGHTTREILVEGSRATSSHLAETLRRRVNELDPRPVGATRVGSVLAYHVALAGIENVDAALRLGTALEDDLLLRFADESVLWIARFDSEAAARAFGNELAKRTAMPTKIDGSFLTLASGHAAQQALARVRAW